MPRLVPALLASLLLVLALAAALSACGSGGSTTIIQTTTVGGDDSATGGDADVTDTTGAETGSDAADTGNTTTDNAAGGPTSKLEQFQTPSENVGCVMFDGGARCDARKHDWDAGPAPADCPLDYGQGIEVGGKGKAHFVCAGDTTLGAGPVLQYGESSAVGGATCSSAEDGVTCTSASGAGFFISIQRYEFLG